MNTIYFVVKKEIKESKINSRKKNSLRCSSNDSEIEVNTPAFGNDFYYPIDLVVDSVTYSFKKTLKYTGTDIINEVTYFDFEIYRKEINENINANKFVLWS